MAIAGSAGVVLAVHQGGVAWAAAPLALTLVGAFWLSAVAEVRQSAAVQLAVTTFGVTWIGLGFGFLVAVRDVPAPHGWGRELLLAVLLARGARTSPPTPAAASSAGASWPSRSRRPRQWRG